jgi:hypothetical protein
VSVRVNCAYFGLLAAVAQNNSSKENFANILCFYVRFKFKKINLYACFVY